MREALLKVTGSKLPVKLMLANGEAMIRYVRGFADQQRNILLISENAFTMALKIVELKDILRAEFAHESTDGEWKVLNAKWLDRPSHVKPE